MEIDLKKNTYIFIEDSVFLEDGFYIQLQNFIEKSKKARKELVIYVDKGILDKVSNYKNNKQLHEAYLLDGLIDILKDCKVLKLIETNSYLDITNLEKAFSAIKNSSKYFLTQKQSVYKTFKDMKGNVSFLKYSNGFYSVWELKQQIATKAFYLDKDNYINKIDASDVDYVYSPKYGYLKLNISSQMTGGEGSVYKTYNNMMVKIFNQENITYTNFKKISKMIDMNLYNPFICWPRDLVYVDKDFVGYVMDEIKDAETLLNLRLQNFSTMSHIDRFELCYSFFKNVQYLHEKGIIIGDLKPDNILVKSPTEVYFIDCGCYQVEDYACPVCHPKYTRRVFKKDELKKELRSFDDEYYPINALAFEILFRKDHTFSPEDGDIENADKDKFYYLLDADKMKSDTEDVMLWKTITPTMRKYFYYYFTQGKITDLSEWITELKTFLDEIRKGE